LRDETFNIGLGTDPSNRQVLATIYDLSITHSFSKLRQWLTCRSPFKKRGFSRPPNIEKKLTWSGNSKVSQNAKKKTTQKPATNRTQRAQHKYERKTQQTIDAKVTLALPNRRPQPTFNVRAESKVRDCPGATFVRFSALRLLWNPNGTGTCASRGSSRAYMSHELKHEKSWVGARCA
jgi:hypothetical protein